MMKRWSRRFFVLEVEDCRLLYRQHRDSKVMRGEIPLRGGMVGLLPALSLHPEWTPFYVYAGSESFAMAAESLEDAQFWVSALVEAVREAGAREAEPQAEGSPHRPGAGHALVPDEARRQLEFAGGRDSASDLSDASPSAPPRERSLGHDARDAAGAAADRSAAAPGDSSLATTSASEAEESASAESPGRRWGVGTGAGGGSGGSARGSSPEHSSSGYGHSPRRGGRQRAPPPQEDRTRRRGSSVGGSSVGGSSVGGSSVGGSFRRGGSAAQGSEGRLARDAPRQTSNAAQLFTQFIHSPVLPGAGKQRSTKDEVLEVMGSVLEDVVKVKHEQLEKVSAALDYAQLELGVARGRVGRLEGDLSHKDEQLAAAREHLQRTLEELADHGKRLAETATKLAEVTLDLDTERQQTKTLKGIVMQLQDDLGDKKVALRGAQGALGSAERAIRQQARQMDSIEHAVTRPFWSPGSPGRGG